VKQWLAVFGACGVLVVVALLYNRYALTYRPKPTGTTLRLYQQLGEGMAKHEVIAILGQPVTIVERRDQLRFYVPIMHIIDRRVSANSLMRWEVDEWDDRVIVHVFFDSSHRCCCRLWSDQGPTLREIDYFSRGKEPLDTLD
jgi:hypothetical protein